MYSDGKISYADLKEKLANYYPVAKVKDISDILENTPNEYLLDFAKNSPVGKKLAIINYYSKILPTFWCAADILWYRSIDIATEVKEAKYYKCI